MKILHICNAYQTKSLYQELFDRIQKANIDQVVVGQGYYKSGSECVNGVQVLYYFRKTGSFQRLFWKHKVNRITKYAPSIKQSNFIGTGIVLLYQKASSFHFDKGFIDIHPKFSTHIFVNFEQRITFQPYIPMLLEIFGKTYRTSRLHPDLRTIW